MFKLAVFFFIFYASTWAIDVLDTPHWVSGMVWHDLNNDGIRQDGEPPFSYVRVTLLAQTSSSLKVFTSDSSQLVAVQEAFTKTDGTYRFSCLTSGYFAVQFHTPENRPSRFAAPGVGAEDVDSDATIFEDGNTARTALFLSESGAASDVDLGLYQYVWINQHSLSGDQWVPSAPVTARGVVYAVLNTEVNEMYYRIIRGDFPGQVADTEGGFYEGWSNENGDKLRDFADRYSPKENVWLSITPKAYADLMEGRVYTVIMGNGSFSTLARLRGQFYNFRNFRQLSVQAQFTGRNVVPPVTTSASGSIDVNYNLDGGSFWYQLELPGLDASQISSIGVYGPATVSTTGPLLTYLDPNTNMMNVSSISNFDQYFSAGELYVQVSTSQYPTGLLRANLHAAQPVVLHSVFNLTNIGNSPIARAEAVFTLDWRKGELYYYVYIEGIEGDEIVTQIEHPSLGTLDLDGPLCMSHENTVKQGYFFGISQQYLNDLYAGQVRIQVLTENGFELFGYLSNWF